MIKFSPFIDQLKNIEFITLKSDLITKDGFKIKKEIPLPILIDKEISTLNIIEGLLYYFAIDIKDDNKKYYKDLLDHLNKSHPLNTIPYKYKNENVLKVSVLSYGLIKASIFDESTYVLLGESLNTLYKELDDKNYLELSKNVFFDGINKFDTWRFNYHIGIIFYNDDEYLEASKYFSNAFRLCDDEEFKNELRVLISLNESKIDFSKAMELFNKNRFNEAIVLLDSLRIDNPEWFELYFYLGLSYREIGDYQSSIESFIRANNIKKDKNAKNLLAISYLLNNEYLKAYEIYKKAVNEYKDDSEVYCNYAISLYHIGKLEEAKEYINKSYKLNSNDLVIKQWLEKIGG